MLDVCSSDLKNDMELDGGIDGEDDENTSDGEVGRVVEEMVCTTSPFFVVPLYIPLPRAPSPLGGAIEKLVV